MAKNQPVRPPVNGTPAAPVAPAAPAAPVAAPITTPFDGQLAQLRTQIDGWTAAIEEGLKEMRALEAAQEAYRDAITASRQASA